LDYRIVTGGVGHDVARTTIVLDMTDRTTGPRRIDRHRAAYRTRPSWRRENARRANDFGEARQG
jgi:hypothetical protein